MKKILLKIYEIFYTTRLSRASNFEKQLVSDLRNEIKEINLINTSQMSGSELEWSNNVNNILTNITTKDPRKFLSWEVIKNTMFVVKEDYIETELKHIINSKKFASNWKHSLVENNIGMPLRYWKYSKSSANLIHHLYHLVKFEEYTNIDFKELEIIFEFGGGYGSMCRLLHNCNFNKKYIIFDLPVFSAIQKFYLRNLGIKVLKPEEYFTSDSGVICISDIKTLNQITDSIKSIKSKLFIATWSLSETPIEFRTNFKPLISNCSYHLIAYQQFFNEADNIKYFKDIESENLNITWTNSEISHLKNNYYLFGKNNENFKENI